MGKNLGPANKRKGSAGEREFANIFKANGFPLCKTSRLMSKGLDNAKVDLYGLPFNVQVKIGYPTGLPAINIFNAMREGLTDNFLPDDLVHKRFSIIIHKYPGKGGRKRTPEETLVLMSEEHWIHFKRVTKYNKFGILWTKNLRGTSYKELLQKHNTSHIKHTKRDGDVYIFPFDTFLETIKTVEKWL